MPSDTQTAPVSKGGLWAGRIMSGLVVAFLAVDVIIKFVTPAPAPVVETFAHLGWSLSLAPVLGTILLVSTALYVIPITSVFGAILLTGYLGGAVSTHLRAGDPLFSHVLFPTYLGVLLWGGLSLREERLRALLPFRRPNTA
jgi:DoxX-like family